MKSDDGPYDRYFYRSQILMAAAEVFAERGSAGTAVAHILVKAKVSRRTFYRYFRNLEAVLFGIYEVATDTFLESLRDAVRSGKNRMDKLERCVDVYLEASARAGRLIRVMEAEALRPGSMLARRRSEMLATAADELAAELAGAKSHGPDPLVIEGAIIALEGIMWRVHADGAPSKADLERARAAMVRSLLAPLAVAGDRVPPLPTQKRRVSPRR